MAYVRNVTKYNSVLRYIVCSNLHTYAKQNNAATVGIVVIGDEILKGEVVDTNSSFISKHLFKMGIRVKKISVIGDDEDEVASEILNFSKNFKYVITTGGIGPTHDDITFQAVAKAFGEVLKPHPELVNICTNFFKTNDLKAPAMKLAHVPESAVLTFGYDKIRQKRFLYPNVSVHNVYLFPGIPSLMEKLFLAVYEKQFAEGSIKLFTKDMYVSATEVAIADQLNIIVGKYSDVCFGSYPKFNNRYYQVHLTIQSEMEERANEAFKALQDILPKDITVNFDNSPLHNAYEKIMHFAEEKQANLIQDTLKQMETFIKRYKIEEICVFFNGEEESIVVLHFLHACVRKNQWNTVICGVNFFEYPLLKGTEEYILETQERYNMIVKNFHGSIKSSLCQFRSENEHIKMILLGCLTSNVKPTIQVVIDGVLSHGPDITCINILGDWSPGNVRNFINSFYLPHSPKYML